MILARCTGGFCPAIHRDGDRVIVVGNRLDTVPADVNVGPGEVAVAIPIDVLTEAAITLLGPDVLAGLIQHAINQLAYADQEDGCCPDCCAPCHSIQALRDASLLDAVLAAAETTAGYEWWDAERQTVDLAFLDRAWRMTGCHDGGE